MKSTGRRTQLVLIRDAIILGKKLPPVPPVSGQIDIEQGFRDLELFSAGLVNVEKTIEEYYIEWQN